MIHIKAYIKGCRGRDRMVARFTATCAISAYPITTKVLSSNSVHGEVYSIQNYVIKFASDLLQVVGFHCVLRFPLPKKLTAMI